MSTVNASRDLIAESRKRFIGDTAKHEMQVVRDDGLYRHLRFKNPSTTVYYFDLVTWPGYLAIVGDGGDFVFSRTRDMFEFFEPSGARGGFEDARWGINPGYWSEKLQAPGPDAATRYSPDLFRERLTEWANQQVEDRPEDAAALHDAVRELLDDDRTQDEHEARRLVYDFECGETRIYDSWDWNLRDHDWRFLWCCWAIVWGISKYRDSATRAANSHSRTE